MFDPGFWDYVKRIDYQMVIRVLAVVTAFLLGIVMGSGYSGMKNEIKLIEARRDSFLLGKADGYDYGMTICSKTMLKRGKK